MTHRRPLIRWAMGTVERYLPGLTIALKMRRLEKRLHFVPRKQALFDATGNLRPLDDIITSVARGISRKGMIRLIPRSKFVSPDRSLSINVEIMRRLGRMTPFSVVEQDVTVKPGHIQQLRSYYLTVNQSLSIAHDRNDKLNTASNMFLAIGNLATDHHIDTLGMMTADTMLNLIEPQNLIDKRFRQALEHWHRCMEHIINGTAGLDPIAALAIQTSRDHYRPVFAPGSRNINLLEQAEDVRRAGESVDGGNAVRINFPSTQGIQIKEGDNETFGAIHFSPEYETVGILALKQPIVIIATQNYTLIEMQIPETIATQYHGKPLSALIDHPLLNTLGFIIDSIDTNPPQSPIHPDRLEKQVLIAIGQHFLLHDCPQPAIDQWFHMQMPVPNPVNPMVMIHHRPRPATIITQEEAMRFQLP